MSTYDLFGSGTQLTVPQMSARALVLFFCMLVLLRVSGMRSFSRKSSFDTVVAITLGAVMSRAVVGASPMVATIAACTVLALLHRLVAIVAATVPAIERVVKGTSHWVYRGGTFDLPRMHRAGISRNDVEQAVRKWRHDASLREVAEVRLESNGELTVMA